MTWVFYAILAYFIWAITNIIDKILVSKYLKDTLALSFLAMFFGSLFDIIFIFLYRGISLLPALILTIVLIAGGIRVISFWLYFKSMAQEEASRVTLLWQTSPIFTLLLAFIFLGERLTLYPLAAFCLLLVGGLLAALKFGSKSLKLSTAFWLMLLSSFIIALSTVLLKYGFLIADFWLVMIWAMFGEMASVIILSFCLQKNIYQSFQSISQKAKGLLIFNQILGSTAFVFFGLALLLGPAALITSSSATNPIFVFLLVILGTLFIPKTIREEISAKVILVKISALLFIGGGMILLALK